MSNPKAPQLQMTKSWAQTQARACCDIFQNLSLHILPNLRTLDTKPVMHVILTMEYKILL